MILKAEQLIETQAETVEEAQIKTHCDSLQDLKIELVMHFLCGVEAIKLLKTRTVKVVMVETH